MRFTDDADLNRQGLEWCDSVAYRRIHRTTRRAPWEMLAEEWPRLAMSALLCTPGCRDPVSLDTAASKQLTYPEMLEQLLGTEVEARRERCRSTRTNMLSPLDLKQAKIVVIALR